jgi:hypothetical protein
VGEFSLEFVDFGHVEKSGRWSSLRAQTRSRRSERPFDLRFLETCPPTHPTPSPPSASLEELSATRRPARCLLSSEELPWGRSLRLLRAGSRLGRTSVMSLPVRLCCPLSSLYFVGMMQLWHDLADTFIASLSLSCCTSCSCWISYDDRSWSPSVQEGHSSQGSRYAPLPSFPSCLLLPLTRSLSRDMRM